MSTPAHANKFSAPQQQVAPQVKKQEEQNLITQTTQSFGSAEDTLSDTGSSRDLQSQLNQAAVFGHNLGQLNFNRSSTPVAQLKPNQSAPIQKQGYGYEDEEQMMSVWHDNPAGMTSPEAPMSVPVTSTSRSAADTETSSSPWAGMTSPEAPMSVAVPTASDSATTYHSSNSRDLSSSPTNSSENSSEALGQVIDGTSGIASLFERVTPTRVNMSNFRNYMLRTRGMRGWETALNIEDAISYPGTRVPGLFGRSENIMGSRLPADMSRASAVLAPLGMITSSAQMYNALQQEDSSPDRYLDIATATPGLFSSTVGTTALAGSGLSAAGSSSLLAGTSTGAALSGVGGGIATATTTLGPAAALAGSFAGGYALSDLIFNDWLGADDAIGGFFYDLRHPEDNMPRTNRRGL